MTKNFLLTGAFAVMLSMMGTTSFAQCTTVRWPEDGEMKAKAEEKKVLYEDALRAGHIQQAIPALNWMLTNVPNFHISLYTNGVDIFDKAASAEKDPAKKKVYVDSLMLVYDLRIKNCGDEAQVVNRKAMSYVKHSANTDPAGALVLMDKAFELNGNNIFDFSLVPYWQVIRLNKLKLKALTEEQIMQRYDVTSNIIDAKIKKAQSEGKADLVAKLKASKDEIDKILTGGLVEINCDFVKKNLEPKFRQNPEDITIARKIFGFMLQGKCTDDPLWLEAGEAVHRLTPEAERDCALPKNLGVKYLSKENFKKAEELLKEAQTICSDSKDKGEVLLYLGAIEAHNGSKSGARALFRQAADADAEVAKEAFEKIGDLYYNSFNDCKKGVSQADDRLVYLIAADYYQRAGNSKKVAMAKASFPSREEIFLVNYKVGDTKSVGCWIGESTTIRTRD